MKKLLIIFFTFTLTVVMLVSCNRTTHTKEASIKQTPLTTTSIDTDIPKDTIQTTITPQTTIATPTTETELFCDLNFSQLKDIGFTFSSGVGAWTTELQISSDGTFTGYHSDSDMGDVDTDYPNGTRYYCSFSGKFTDLKKIGEFEYSMRCEYINQEGTPDQAEIGEDGIRYITSSPYGLDDAKEILLFLPGSKVNKLPKEFLDWVHVSSDNEDMAKTLGFYGLYNVGGAQGFSGYVLNTIIEKEVAETTLEVTKTLDISTNDKTDWRQVYAKHLKPHIDSPFEEYFSLYDFDRDSIPELIMASSVEYTPTTFFTVRNGEIRWFKWSTDVYSDYSPYIYYDTNTKLHGIVAPYSKRTPEDNDRIPLFYYDSEEDFVDNGYIMYETESEIDNSKMHLFHTNKFGDGTEISTIGSKYNDFYVINKLTYDYLKEEMLNSNKKLPKHLITADGITNGLNNYKPVDIALVEHNTSLSGYLNYIFKYAKDKNLRLVNADKYLNCYNILATDGQVYQVIYNSLIEKFECTNKHGDTVDYEFNLYTLAKAADLNSKLKTMLYKDVNGKEYLALNYHGKPDANYGNVPVNDEFEYVMDKTIYLYFDGEQFVLDNEIIYYEYSPKGDSFEKNVIVIINGEQGENPYIQNKYKYIDDTSSIVPLAKG